MQTDSVLRWRDLGFLEMKKWNIVSPKNEGHYKNPPKVEPFFVWKRKYSFYLRGPSLNLVMEVSIWLILKVVLLWLIKIFKEVAPAWKYRRNLNGAFSVQLQKQKPFLTHHLPNLEYGKKFLHFCIMYLLLPLHFHFLFTCLLSSIDRKSVV